MKQIVLIVVAFFSIVSVGAQEFKWGVTGGLNISSPTDYDSKVGYFASKDVLFCLIQLCYIL